MDTKTPASSPRNGYHRQDEANGQQEELTEGSIRPQDYHVDPAVLTLLPCEQAIRFRTCPIALTELPRGARMLIVACPDPSNLLLIDQLQQVTGCRIQPMRAEEQDVLFGIATHYHDAGKAGIRELLPPSGQYAATATDRVAGQAPVILSEDSPTARNTLDRLFRRAISERATDIHIEPHEEHVIARFRIDGVLYDHTTYDPALHPAVISRIKILSNLDIAQTRSPQDGRFDVQFGRRVFDVRVSIVPTMEGESCVMRLLPKGTVNMTLPELGLREQDCHTVARMIHQPYGMILCTGPTGSGKTTTLYTCLATLDCVGKKVITIEDPVEYQFPRVSQMQVNNKVGLTFAAGLRSILRQDPDIVMVGEIRDVETLDMAIHSSLTGHLVLTTLHCNDASSAPSRMVDMGAEPFLVASSVSGLIAQRLIRRICKDCKQPVEVSDELRDRLQLPNDETVYYQGTGCSMCRDTGFFGRISVFEVVPMSDELEHAIIRNASAGEFRQIVRSVGCASLLEDGLAKARAGITSLEEVVRAIYADI